MTTVLPSWTFWQGRKIPKLTQLSAPGWYSWVSGAIYSFVKCNRLKFWALMSTPWFRTPAFSVINKNIRLAFTYLPPSPSGLDFSFSQNCWYEACKTCSAPLHNSCHKRLEFSNSRNYQRPVLDHWYIFMEDDLNIERLASFESALVRTDDETVDRWGFELGKRWGTL